MKKFLLVFFPVLAVIIYSCNDEASNSISDQSGDNKVRMQQFYDEVINAHNVAMIDSFCTADFVDHNPDQGFSGKGIDDLKSQFTQMFAAFPDAKVDVDFLIAKGDTVVSHVTMSATNSGPMGPMPATNKSFKISGIDIVVIKDGKATERWGQFDAMSMMSQLGMMPSGDASNMDNKQ